MALRQFAAVAVCVAAAAGCAGRPPASPKADTSNPSVRSCLDTAGASSWQGTVRARNDAASIDARDDYFAASCILVPWDQPVRLIVTNRGHVPHDVTLPLLDLKTDIDAGQTVFVTLPATTVPLKFLCSYHASEHMFGAVVPVRSAKDRLDAGQ